MLSTVSVIVSLPPGATLLSATAAFDSAKSIPASVNVAVTSLGPSIATVQSAVPAHAPVQPVNADPTAGAALSVTTMSAVNVSLQVSGHAMPDGTLVTDPMPVPAIVTAKTNPADAASWAIVTVCPATVSVPT